MVSCLHELNIYDLNSFGQTPQCDAAIQLVFFVPAAALKQTQFSLHLVFLVSINIPFSAGM